MILGGPPDVIPDHLTAEEYYSLGTWYHETHKFEKARQSLEKAIALDTAGDIATRAKQFIWQNLPKHNFPDEAILEFRKVQAGLGDVTNTSEALEKIIQEHPGFEWPLNVMAQVHINKGNPEEALICLRKALDINPNFHAALAAKALAHTINMDYPEAEECIKQALTVVPDDQQLLNLRRSLSVLAAVDQAELN